MERLDLNSDASHMYNPGLNIHQCWFLSNWNLGNKLQSNLKKNTTIVIKWYKLKMSSIGWRPLYLGRNVLTHWSRVTHICVSKLTIIGSDNGLSPDPHQAIIWTNAGLLLIGPLRNKLQWNIEILTSSFKKMRLKVSSAKRRPFCLPQCVNGQQYIYIAKQPAE